MEFESEPLGDPVAGSLYDLGLMVAVQHRHDAVIEQAPGCSPTSLKQGLRRAIVDAGSSDPILVRSWPTPRTRGASACEHPGRACRTEDRAPGPIATADVDFDGRRHWITPLTPFFSGLLSRICHASEVRRIRAAWETIDDRTLKDIGVSRYEIEYTMEAGGWR